MTKSKLSDIEKVTENISKLPASVGYVIEAIRALILSTDESIGEQVKWNSPSFYYTGEMKPFDPKEYKRDIVVINFHRGNILLVFPTGAKLSSDYNVLEGNYPDGRKIAKIIDTDDLASKANGLQLAIKEWLSLIEK